VTATAEHVDLFAALGDPTRRAVLNILAARGEASATAIASRLPVSRPAVVKHLGVLDRAGLLEERRQGREVLFSVRPEPLASASRWLAAVASEWDRRLTALKRLAEDS
jgi:DNA-binding transcriptional ArsR family regulator